MIFSLCSTYSISADIFGHLLIVNTTLLPPLIPIKVYISSSLPLSSFSFCIYAWQQYPMRQVESLSLALSLALSLSVSLSLSQTHTEAELRVSRSIASTRILS